MTVLPVVYVHGAVGHLRFPELRQGLDGPVLTPDLIGYGAFSGSPSPAMAVSRQAAHLGAQIALIVGDTPAVLVGHGGGTVVCMRLALSQPQRVAAVVGIGGWLEPSVMFSGLAAMSPARAAGWFAEARRRPEQLLATDHVLPTPSQVERLRDWLHHQPAATALVMARALLAESTHPSFLTQMYAALTQTPTYLVRGDRAHIDAGCDADVQRLVRTTLVVEGAGEAAVLERPERVASLVAQICRTLV